ncbi:extracellular solute-binding protein [Isoalcanivorax indicus]|uniref:extracellular solute-binding protein n=1 Tax=Isoalcanivorax indicus TaxID=2202653 RepID=UPI000DBAAA04|nr:extracellular solute-binding protein [Isoalcanivorax indicus]
MKTFLRRPSQAAFVEDALTIYSAGPGALARHLVADFRSAAGCQVNLLQDTTGRLLARLEAEAASPVADVVMLASWDAAREMEQAGQLQPVALPDPIVLPTRYRTSCLLAQGVSVLGMAWRQASGRPPPPDWQALAAAEFKGRLCMPDPALSGATLDLLLGLERAWGEGLWALLAQLRDGGLVVPGANSQALLPVIRGERDLVFGCVDYLASSMQAREAGLRFILPQSGTVSAARPMMVLRGARHADLAWSFIAHVLSAEGQQRVQAAGLTPVIGQDQASPLAPALLSLPASPDSARLALLTRFADLFGGEFAGVDRRAVPLGWA